MVDENPDLEIGESYSKEQIETLFGLKFGYRINGIVIRTLEPGSDRRLILLFQRSGGPYPDSITNDRITYIGAGLRGDQLLRGVNRVLKERGSIDGVRLFHQRSGSELWSYLGSGTSSFAGEDMSTGRKLIMFEITLDRR